MNFSQLDAFFLIVQEGSISSAAERLFISPSALTQQVKKLERELGFSLFARKHSGVTLTDAGRVFYHEAFQSVARMESAILSGKAIATHQKVFHVHLENAKHASALQAFCLDHPEITIHHVELPPEELDFALDRLDYGDLDIMEWEFTEKGRKRGFMFDQTEETFLCAMMSYRNPLARKESVTIEELNREHAIFYLSLWSAQEQLADTDLSGMTMVNTLFSPVDAMNRAESGSVFLMEDNYASILCPFGKKVPVMPRIPISYGFMYKKGNTWAEEFLIYVRTAEGS